MCGSVAHCDPEGDWNSVMLAVGATVVAVSAEGERTITIDDFIVDFFTNSLQAGEMVKEVRVPILPGRKGGAYLKLHRKVGDYATVGVATHLEFDDAGKISKAGIGLTSVGPHNLRAAEAEAALVGQDPGEELFDHAGSWPRRAANQPRMYEDLPSTSGRWSRNTPSGDYSKQRTGATEMQITVKINGTDYEGDVEPRLLLIDFIRSQVGLTGTHIGCDTSSCGACTVIFNGKPMKSCTMFAVQADGTEIGTVEGLKQEQTFTPFRPPSTRSTGCNVGSAPRG